MAYVNVAEWKTDQVCEWLKGLDNCVLPYVHTFMLHNMNGQQLLSLRPEDLDYLGISKLGHQEIILEAVEYLRNFHYELDRENLQLLALRLSCKAHSLYNELVQYSGSEAVTTQTLSDVASIITAVKPLVRWLDRPPFSGQLDYNDKKMKLLKLSLEMATCAQRDRFAEKPIEEIRTTCGELTTLADYIIQEIMDPMILQPATLDLATLKRPGDDLGFYILPSFHGAHQITEIKFGSAAHQCGKMEDGDEIVQVNYQTVVGWERKKVLELFRENPDEVLLTLKRRPRHTKVYGQIYIKPYRLPSNKKISYSTRWQHNLPSPRPELLSIPDFIMPLPRHQTKKPSPEPVSILDTVDILNPVATDTSDSDDSEIEPLSTERLYSTKPRNLIQRRATITGASPTAKYAVDIEQFWKELKQAHSTTFRLRDKAASCAHGLDESAQTHIRPQTYLGIEQCLKKPEKRTVQFQDLDELKLEKSEKPVKNSEEIPVPAPRTQIFSENSEKSCFFKNSEKSSGSVLVKSSEKSLESVLPKNPEKSSGSVLVKNSEKSIGSILPKNLDKSSGLILKNSEKSSGSVLVKNSEKSLESILPKNNENKVATVEQQFTRMLPSVIKKTDSFVMAMKNNDRVFPEVEIVTIKRSESADEKCENFSLILQTFERSSNLANRKVLSSFDSKARTFRPLQEPEKRPRLTPPEPPKRRYFSKSIVSSSDDEERLPLAPKKSERQSWNRRREADSCGDLRATRPFLEQYRGFTEPAKHGTTIFHKVPSPSGSSRQLEIPREKTNEMGTMNRAITMARSIGLHATTSASYSGKSPRSLRKKNTLLAKRRNISVKDVSPGDLEGWLTYRGKGAGGSWVRAWFVLKYAFLYRFESQDSQKASCLISLTGYTVSQASEVKSRKYAFKVYHTGTVFYFSADTEDTLSSWLDAVNKATLGNDANQSELYSETDESDAESRKSKSAPSSAEKTAPLESGFGSLKKFVRRDGTSLDRKYLKFLSAKSRNYPVPTEQFRSYRRVLPSSSSSLNS